MATVLFLSFPLAGHINPSLSLVRELVERGDQVIYCATDHFAVAIQQAGAQYCRYRNSFLTDLTGLPDRLDALSWLLMRTTAELLDEHLHEFRKQHPDYVIADSVAPWGQWIAEILCVPVITSVSTFAFNRRVLAFAAKRGIHPRSARLFLSKLRHIVHAVWLRRELRRRYGVRGPGITGLVIGHSDLNIVYTSRHFQPLAESFDDRFQFIGPPLKDRRETAEFPWEQVRHRIVVYISLGTLFNTDAAFYKHCFEAFQNQDLQVILSVGTKVNRESLGAVPANFIVRTHVPQLDVLRRCTIFITHGGMNSVSESLYYGVPLIVVPQMSEQAIIGRRVEEIGAGLYLAREDATADTLRQSAQRLLSEDHFRRQAAVVRESFQTARGVARAADAILRFTTARSKLQIKL